MLKVHKCIIAQKNRNEKSLKRSQFFLEKIFSTKNLQNPLIFVILGRKMAKTKIFGRIFWSESIQNGPKRILKRKSRFRTISHYDLTKPFFRKMGSQVEKMAKTKNFGRNFFFGRNRFRMVRNVF